MKIALFSDTHGIFRPDWMDIIKDCTYLMHTGDFHTRKCYETFLNIGIPSYMVRGNCDKGEWASYLPEFMPVVIGGKMFYLVHNRADLPLDLTDADFIIYGHTHIFSHENRHGKIYINPGSAGNDRGDGKHMAILELQDDDYKLQQIRL